MPPKRANTMAVIREPSVPPSAENTRISPVIAACAGFGSALSTTELMTG